MIEGIIVGVIIAVATILINSIIHRIGVQTRTDRLEEKIDELTEGHKVTMQVLLPLVLAVFIGFFFLFNEVYDGPTKTISGEITSFDKGSHSRYGSTPMHIEIDDKIFLPSPEETEKYSIYNAEPTPYVETFHKCVLLYIPYWLRCDKNS